MRRVHRLAYANLGNAPDPVVEADVKLLGTVAEHLACSEAGDRQRLLRRYARRTAARLWAPSWVPGARSVPILSARPGLRRGARLAVPRMYVGPGAGPSWSKAKAITWWRFPEFDLLTTHMIASATRQGRRYALRRVHYRLHLAVLCRMVRRRLTQGRSVVVLLDANANPWHPLLAPLAALLTQVNDQPTHHGRTIDHAWLSEGLELAGPVEVLEISSDHGALFLRVREVAE